MKILKNEALAPFTTVKIGGPAQTLIITDTTQEFIEALQKTGPSDLFILGNGSNILISDRGLSGTVIKNNSSSFKILKNSAKANKKLATISARRNEEHSSQYLNFGALDYDESDKPKILVKIDSGCKLPQIINQLIDLGITGLQWFAYIPATIGGAVYNNIHGGAYHFSDFIESIEVFDLLSKSIKTLQKSDIHSGL